ncbi:hypothetical protein Aduo_018789 [Ancylostoma duodenale]
MLNGGKKFSKLDLSDAYMQVELDPESRKYTTINTQKGLFEYTRVPFGIASAPAMFQRTMETTLSGIEGVLIYLDDITVTGPDDKTHMERLEKVLRRLKEVGFRLKREKCEFFKQEMEFLGHVVDANGIRPSPSKLKAILNMPEPKNIKELESYLGMERRGVELGKEQVEAFKAIQGKLASTDTLAHYNPDVPVVLATNASEYGLGAVIYHKYSDNTEKVIAYASRSLTKEERNYAQIEKEALGIVYGVEKFNQFLYGRQFTLLTDHQPLVRIFGRKLGLPVIAAKRLHRWALRLMVYSFNIEYRRTEDFGNADGLSRLPDPRELPSAERVINEVQMQQMAEETFDRLPMTVEEIAEATTEDEILQKVIAFMQRGWPEKAKVERLRPFAAKKSSLSLYKGLFAQHWEKLPLEYPCTHGKNPRKFGLRLHIDFCETANGAKWLIVVDAKSKWPEVMKMGSTTAEKTAVNLKEVFSRHGLPEQLVSDNGPPFTSRDFREYCEYRGIEQIFTPPYHPNSNGDVAPGLGVGGSTQAGHGKRGFYQNPQGKRVVPQRVTKQWAR